MEPLSALLVALFGAGGAGAVSGIITLVKTIKQGKVDSEETLLKRLDADNRQQQERTREAEKRADEAEKEAEAYRRQRDAALEKAARLRLTLIANKIEPPAGTEIEYNA